MNRVELEQLEVKTLKQLKLDQKLNIFIFVLFMGLLVSLAGCLLFIVNSVNNLLKFIL